MRDPDCLRCMRKKLRATGIAVFFQSEEGWRLSSYQGERPSEAAEIEAYSLLAKGVPEAVARAEKGLVLVGDEAILAALPGAQGLFSGQSIVAAQVRIDNFSGVRIAWRDCVEPFDALDLATIQCVGNCPPGCCPECIMK